MGLHTNYDIMFDNIIKHGENYLNKYPGVKTMVVGLSGGIDSALTAALAREMCNRTMRHRLIGVSIPIVSNKKSEIKRAIDVGISFCDEFKEIKSIDRVFKLAGRFFKPKSIAEKIRLGNIKARLRMLTLYDIAHRNNGIVLSTDNLSELNLGFWTLHGDVGDFGLIQSLWKTEVYGLSKYLCNKYRGYKRRALDMSIYATPTDGLGVSTSDFDQLGVKSYEEADDILIKYIEADDGDIKTKRSLEKHPIIQRHIKYAFKRENPYNIPREDIINDNFNITKGMSFTVRDFD
jgi:nicotinamide-nucleotide amidase